MTGEAKIKGCKDFLENILHNPETKFIIFAHHQRVMDELEKHLKSKMGGDSLMRIDGATDAVYR